jgi:predicted RNA binding protein YcfA (HicA-like mRNA interferase family)
VTKLPRISGRECIDALMRCGFRVCRQSGSHVVLRRDKPFAQVVVPDHKELDRGTLRAILRQTDLSVDELIARLH